MHKMYVTGTESNNMDVLVYVMPGHGKQRMAVSSSGTQKH